MIILKSLISEADASAEAKKKGLEHLGHGIYGKPGKPMYKSENGKLVAIKGAEKKGAEIMTRKDKKKVKPKVNIFDAPKEFEKEPKTVKYNGAKMQVGKSAKPYKDLTHTAKFTADGKNFEGHGVSEKDAAEDAHSKYRYWKATQK